MPSDTTPSPSPIRTWFSVQQASEYTSLSAALIRRAAQKGELAASKTSSGAKKAFRYVFHRDDLDAWLRAKRTATPAAANGRARARRRSAA